MWNIWRNDIYDVLLATDFQAGGIKFHVSSSWGFRDYFENSKAFLGGTLPRLLNKLDVHQLNKQKAAPKSSSLSQLWASFIFPPYLLTQIFFFLRFPFLGFSFFFPPLSSPKWICVTALLFTTNAMNCWCLVELKNSRYLHEFHFVYIHLHSFSLHVF